MAKNCLQNSSVIGKRSDRFVLLSSRQLLEVEYHGASALISLKWLRLKADVHGEKPSECQLVEIMINRRDVYVS